MKNYILLFVLLITSALSAQELTGFEKEIKDGIEKVLTDYQKFASFSKNGNNIDLEYSNLFKELFAKAETAIIYNDIEPDKTSGETLNATNYVQNVQKNYIRGLSVSMDVSKARLSKVYPFKKSKTYIVNSELTKKVFGLYQKNKIQDISIDLVFQIVFDTKNGSPGNFKIYTIQTKENAYDITTAKEEKFAYGFVITPTYTQINSTNITSNNGWESTGQIAISGGLDFTYQFMPGLSIKTGIHYSNYKTNNVISNYDYRSSELTTDNDNDTYYKDVSANLKEVNQISSIEIPLQVKYTFLPSSKMKFYVFGGISMSYSMSAKYIVSGNATLRGYYSDYNVLLEDIPDYGFETNTYDNLEGDWLINQLNFFGNLGFGVSFKTGYKSSLNIGPVVNISLNDLKYQEAKYKDDFYNSFGDPGKTSVMSFGLSISFMMF